tara:strand:- start:11 stop:340 length:330 start_codon:yes stop_codon:yes gene_type:complete
MINVSYTNWRGETAVRRVLLGSLRFGANEWHTEPTWLISAFDLDHPAQIWKEFDLSKCDFNRDYMPDTVDRMVVSLEKISMADISQMSVDDCLREAATCLAPKEQSNGS